MYENGAIYTGKELDTSILDKLAIQHEITKQISNK